MRRRFGRRRRGNDAGDGRDAAIDAASWLPRIREANVVPLRSLDPLESDEVPSTLAALGRGESEDGRSLILSFAPRDAGDALLGGLAAAAQHRETAGFDGDVVAVAPQWSGAARRRFSLVGELPYAVRAIAASSLAEAPAAVEPELTDRADGLSPDQVAGHLSRPADRRLFRRAASALEGLASKHAGSVRAVGRSVELVVMARRAAELRADDGGVQLTSLVGQRETTRLTDDKLTEALDRLEGVQLRRHLNDRRVREGEDGVRARVLPLFAIAQSLRAIRPWPLAGADPDVIDLLGVDTEGRCVVAAARLEIGLAELGRILDATLRLQSSLPARLAGVAPPVQLDAVRLLLAAQTFAPGVLRVLPALTLPHDLYQILESRGRETQLTPYVSGEAAPRVREARPTRRPRDSQSGRDQGGREAGRDQGGRETGLDQGGRDQGGRETGRDQGGRERSGRDRGAREQGGREPAAEESRVSEERQEAADRPRRRGRRGRGRGDGRQDGRESERERGALRTADSDRAEAESPREAGTEVASDDGARRSQPRYEEVSLFDLDDDSLDEDGPSRRRRRGRGRRRGRRGTGDAPESAGDEPARSGAGADPGRGSRGRSPRRSLATAAVDKADDAEDLAPAEEDADLTELAELPDEVEDFDTAPEPRYDEEEDLGEERDPAEDALALERERRRLARQRASAAEAEAPRPPRRRMAIVAHADRGSLMAALLLARDSRQLEGIWIYPQSELMTFFRGGATDLREDATIVLIGFTASPVREVLQAVTLYRERLEWFDSHSWPPEDLESLRQAIGPEAVHVVPGAQTALPQVIETCTRRSRFSDKLVDLAAGRFTDHDYERWGRLWWWRLGEIVKRPGERRSELEPLLAGRPSDLARDAAEAELPPVPEEVAFVSQRDFRLVHFAGYAIVVLEVPAEIDAHLAARIARERHDATLSLATIEGEEIVLFAGDDGGGRRSLEFGTLVEHIVSKHEWAESLPDRDHVARFRVRDLPRHPERLDQVIGEIAMGRSILER